MIDVFDPKLWPGIDDYDVGQLDFCRKKWTAIRPYLPDSLDGLSVLDIGCWSGYASLAFAVEGATVTGCDVVAGRLKRGREQARRFGVEVRLLQKNLFRIADWWEPESVDITWATGVYHNLVRTRDGIYSMAWTSRDWLVLEGRTDAIAWSQIRAIEPHGDDYHTQTSYVPSCKWVESHLYAAGFEVVRRIERYAGDRSIFIARRRPVMTGSKTTDLGALPNGTIIDLPMTHPALVAVRERKDGADRQGASGAPAWTAHDISERFNPALFVPVVWNPSIEKIGDGEHRVLAARRLGIKRLRVMAYLGPYSNTICGGCSPQESV